MSEVVKQPAIDTNSTLSPGVVEQPMYFKTWYYYIDVSLYTKLPAVFNGCLGL